ncbi:nuclear transport factor 2 (NTF2) family protein with RNA binding (RRM-RBD-RNP motifs) domain-containing protein [Actinidia rufa]|uniref:Nuclear transport factor 2 (NTF2) family protein with RNA binding (RRM-RBD-RNP motifs) domain-containing protein n=1 Tax=Actinidia rufa TaxID=165716 RepID=A0A7J0E8I9_9ERIC|nr:nuclear transport factor 2 (NTF2) family protein with RNA binding (RRM-RBD-RNP motifs) domain-containing protein [Actinidia rufa]
MPSFDPWVGLLTLAIAESDDNKVLIDSKMDIQPKLEHIPFYYPKCLAAISLIHWGVIMSLNYTGVEIKTAHSLESWNGGILVMVSGSVLIKNFSGRRQFVQTFFLAPQEKGYFVLNDIFHFIDDEPLHQHPVAYLSQSNVDSNLYASAAIREPVSNYVMDRETQTREFVSPADVKENGPVDTYSFSEEPLQHIPEAESILDGNFAESNGSLENSVDRVPDHLSAPVEEPVGEPQKRTYASIVAKGQSATRSPPQSSVSKSTPLASEWNHEPEPPTQQSVASSTAVESSGAEAAEDFSALEDEGEIKSVYVRNLPSTVSAVEIEEEFKKFGRLKPDAVAIRNRKDIGVCYAFVEFEDINGVQNAIKASMVQIAGQQIFIEERRANRINAFRGGRRGRGRGGYGYPTEVPRGRFGARSFGSRNGYEGGNYDYNRLRGNGFYRPASQQDRGFSSYQVSRSEQNQSE